MNLPLHQYTSLLHRYLRDQRGRVLLLALSLLGTIALDLVNPQILRYFIDTARAGGAVEALVRAALLFMGIALAQQAVGVGAAYLSEKVGWNATNALRADLARHALQLDMSFHNARTPGEMIERVDEDVTALANFFSQFVIHMLGNALLVAGILLFLFREQWTVGLVTTLFVALALVALNVGRRLATPYWIRGRETSAALASFFEERLAGVEDIRSSGATAYKMRLLHIHLRDLLERYLDAHVKGVYGPLAATGLSVLAFVAVLALGAYWYVQGTMTIGTVFLISYYSRQLDRPLRVITQQIEDLQRSGASIERVRELMQVRSAVLDGPGTHFPPGSLSVQFEQVRFAYHPETPVLRDLSFSLEAGQVLGLLGRTGSGKTTLTRLLFRLYDPQQGEVRVGGVNVREGRLAALRERVGMVTQEVQLFRGTVRDNLTFFDEHVPDEAIHAAIAELGLSTWFERLPEGLNTLLGAGGGGLSAGEAQLLAFTRIFLKNPGVVILDEASSRLDPATERLLERAMERLLQGRTGIIVAHRLATIHRADQIMILEQGRIVEQGTRKALATDSTSRFAQLLRTGLEEALA